MSGRRGAGRGTGIAAVVLAGLSVAYAVVLRLRFDQSVEAELAQQDPVSLFFAFVGWLSLAVLLALVTGIVGLIAGCLRAVALAILAGLLHAAAWLAAAPVTLIELSGIWMAGAKSPVLALFVLVLMWAVIALPFLGAAIGLRRSKETSTTFGG